MKAKLTLLFFLILSAFKSKADSTYVFKAEPARDLVISMQLNSSTNNRDGFYKMQYKKSVLVSGHYKNGLKDGPWEFFKVKDTLEIEGSYKNDKREGLWVFYHSSGTPSCKINYSNGNIEGELTSFHPNGKIALKENYVNHSRQGESVFYDENGKLISRYVYINDTLNGPFVRFYSDGVKREEGYYKKGERDSVYRYYYESGVLWEDMVYKMGGIYNVVAYNSEKGEPMNQHTIKDGNGRMKSFDKKGTLLQEVEYKDGKKNGKYKSFDDGKLEYEGNYVEGCAEGKWMEYNTIGGYTVTIYSGGLKNGPSTTFGKEANILSQQNYKGGEMDGTYSRFNDEGELLVAGQYRDGIQSGIWVSYDKKGKVLFESDYSFLSDTTTLPVSNFCNVKDPYDEVYVGDEYSKEPTFPGGVQALYKFLSENIKYPAKSREQNIQGRVFVSFEVSMNGEIRNVKIIRGVNEELDKEVVRIIRALPRWSCGTLYGRPVGVSYNLPINFSLK